MLNTPAHVLNKSYVKQLQKLATHRNKPTLLFARRKCSVIQVIDCCFYCDKHGYFLVTF